MAQWSRVYFGYKSGLGPLPYTKAIWRDSNPRYCKLRVQCLNHSANSPPIWTVSSVWLPWRCFAWGEPVCLAVWAVSPWWWQCRVCPCTHCQQRLPSTQLASHVTCPPAASPALRSPADSPAADTDIAITIFPVNRQAAATDTAITIYPVSRPVSIEHCTDLLSI